MISREFTPKRTICKLTLSLPEDWAEKEVAVAGDFNNWDTEANKLKKKDGTWSTTLRLKPNNKYEFKYLIDQERWVNDDEADQYKPNEFGTENSVVVIGK